MFSAKLLDDVGIGLGGLDGLPGGRGLAGGEALGRGGALGHLGKVEGRLARGQIRRRLHFRLLHHLARGILKGKTTGVASYKATHFLVCVAL